MAKQNTQNDPKTPSDPAIFASAPEWTRTTDRRIRKPIPYETQSLSGARIAQESETPKKRHVQRARPAVCMTAPALPSDPSAHESAKRSGFQICPQCGYPTSSIRRICPQCGEPIGRRDRAALDRAAAYQRAYRRRKGLKGRPPGPPARPVRVIGAETVFPSIEAAARILECNRGNVYRAIERAGHVRGYRLAWAEAEAAQ